MDEFRLRSAADDDAALALLAESSPDRRAVAFSPEYHVPASSTSSATRERSLAVVAESGTPPAIVGSARLDIGTCRFEGALTSYGLLSALLVST